MVYPVGPPSVVAGVDGSLSSRSAACVAAGYSVRHRLPLRLVCGYLPASYSWPALGLAGYVAVGSRQARDEASAALATVAEELRAAYPGLSSVTIEPCVGRAAAVLIAASRLAAVTVVGSRGSRTVGGMMLCSVAGRVAARAHSTVIVARAESGDVDHRVGGGGPVLVGVDWSDHAAGAVRFAVDEAAARAASLVVAHAHRVPATGWRRCRHDMLDALELLSQLSDPCRVTHPGLVVHTQLIPATDPARAMVDVAGWAALTVVGGRGDGGYRGLRLGSVARALVRDAATPVAIVRLAR
jgi:nucleotide-binding universal stress UspA family protein